jgi:hypothetical protein
MKHTHLDRWTCASGKWMIRDTSEVLVIGLHMVGRFEYGFVIKVLENLWSKKIRGASLLLLLLLLLFYFLLIFLSFFFSHFILFFLLFFSSHHIFSFFIFFFCSSELLQHNTYIAFVRWCNDSSPMLEWCSSSSIKRGEWLLKYKFYNLAKYLNLHREFYSILKLGCGQGGDHKKMFFV